MKIHHLYHSNCADGFAAACVAKYASLYEEDALTFQAVHYDDPQQTPTGLRSHCGDEVVYLDYTPPQSAIDALMGKTGDYDALSLPEVGMLTIIDHHASAAAIHQGLEFTADTPIRSIFDGSKSGALLTWEHMRPMPVPHAIELLNFYDLGGPWNDPENAKSERAKDLQAGLMRGMARSFDAWLPVLLDEPDGPHITECINRGTLLRGRAQGIIAAACRTPLWLDIAGHRVPALTGLAGEHINDAAHLLLQLYKNTAPFACTFHVQTKTGRIKYSLRSRRGGMNVAEVAAQMEPPRPGFNGGGGHPSAAGFSSLDPIPFANT